MSKKLNGVLVLNGGIQSKNAVTQDWATRR